MKNDTNIVLKKNIFGIIAVVIAFISLSIALIPTTVETISPPPEVKIDITQTIKDKAKSLFSSEEEQQAPPLKAEPKIDYDKIKRISGITSIVLGLIAFMAAIISYIKSENKRLYKSTFAICTVALLVNFHWLAIFMLVLLLIFIFSGDFTGGAEAGGLFDFSNLSPGGVMLLLFFIAIPILFIATFVLDLGVLAIIAIIVVLFIIGYMASSFMD
ncbi:MAG: hypothetical protein PQ612_05675 [Rickettsiales bacterium]|nr:hypothetical protein [Pseudomonadota bacterium]MDA0966509.1 hypothetical protein [Pseudomonadota bacterium]MDG4543371.1 hypothetical protein [Rickettsiales bacterium]MDG4545637.1 hypothetical protein [Rickettsiales bacterium]MDG4548086.1 hypothetical protein [Rickettsiales bacterium]